MASHTPIYQKRGSTVVPVITIDDAPSQSANAAGHLVDSNGIANAIAAVEAKIPDLEGVKDIRVSGTTMTVTYIDDSTKTFPLAVSSSTTGPTYSDFVGATASAAGSNGLVPEPAAGKHTSFLRGDGKWVAVPNPDMVGATSTSNGVHGLVPQPKIAEREKYLRGDGTWSTPPDTDTTYSVMTKATATAAGTSGLVPAPGAGKQASFLRGDGTWVVPTNTTYSNMTAATASAAGTAGLVPAPAAGKQTSFLRGDGTWVVPTNTTYSVFTGATTDAAGTSGLVPQPAKGTAGRFLRVDGTWSTPPDTNTTYSVFTGATTDAAGTSGLVPKPAKGTTGRFLRVDGTWSTPPDTNTTYSNMKGATTSAAGTAGLVPAPAAGKQTSFLRGDGTWVVPTNTTYSNMTGATADAAGTAGLVPAPAKGRQNYYLKGDGTWVAASWLPLTGGTLANTSGAAGTNTATGLAIGNNKSVDAAGNTYGRLALYGKTSAGDAQAYYTWITPTRFTANRTHTLPNATGYLATGSTSGVGDATTPVYMSSAGVLTACSFPTNGGIEFPIVYGWSSSTTHPYASLKVPSTFPYYIVLDLTGGGVDFKGLYAAGSKITSGLYVMCSSVITQDRATDTYTPRINYFYNIIRNNWTNITTAELFKYQYVEKISSSNANDFGFFITNSTSWTGGINYTDPHSYVSLFRTICIPVPSGVNLKKASSDTTSEGIWKVKYPDIKYSLV